MMTEAITIGQISWIEFISWSLIFIALWVIISLVGRIANKSKWLRSGLDPSINRGIVAVQMTYTPLMVTGILALFVAVRPLLHGIFVLLLVLFSIQLVRNYFTGLMLRYQTNLKGRTDIKYLNQIYKVQRLSNSGVHLSSPVGDRFVTYVKLQENGFDRMSEKTAAVSSRIYITAPADMEAPMVTIRRVVYNSPFLDFTTKPLIEKTSDNPSSIRLELGMQGREDLQSFKDHLRSLGFDLQEE